MCTLYEPCCGSAALSMYLLGAKKAILPYQGSKWRYRFALEELLKKQGMTELPSKLILADVSFWPIALKNILNKSSLEELILKLKEISKYDAKEYYDSINNSPIPEDEILASAQFLFLQRLAFSGKAVGLSNGYWKSPGFNKTSAYGIAATDKFGEVKPMIPSLIRTLEGYRNLKNIEVIAISGNAFIPETEESLFAYIDPPYFGTTEYPDGHMSRYEVIKFASQLDQLGYKVLVSEKEPIDINWNKIQIFPGKNNSSPFKGKHEEWVTHN